jgi:GGDEF domain-containing protein
VDLTYGANVLLNDVREPLVASGRTMRLSASIGLTAATAADDHDALLRRADAAMYDAKATGRDAAIFR